MSFGSYLRKIRGEVMTQRELADRIGVGYPYISKLENNIEMHPSDEVLVKLAQVLNIDIDEIYIKARKIPKDIREFISDRPEIYQLIRCIQQNQNTYYKKTLGFIDQGSYYQQIFQNNKKCMLLIDPNTAGIIDANTSATRFYQYPRNKITNMLITEINILSKHQVFMEMEKAKTEQRNHFLFKHKLRNDVVKDVVVYSDPITISGKTYLHSIVDLL